MQRCNWVYNTAQVFERPKPTGSTPVGNRPVRSQPSRVEGSALLVAIGANLLVWSVLALSAAGLYSLPWGAHKAVMPVATRAFAPTVPIALTSISMSSVPSVDDETAVPLSTVAPALVPTGAPAGVPLLPIGEDTLVIALLGIDSGRTSNVWRTDSIMLLFIEQGAKRVGILSVPRDLWVYIPDHGYGRINTVDALGEQAKRVGGGLALLDRTLRYNLGVPIDHYVRIDFDGFVRIIDAVGGVTVDVEIPIADIFPDPLAPDGEFRMDLPAGPQHMDGRTALAYCRSRLSTSDFDRARRQQEVVMALWKQAFTVETLAQAPHLWATFRDVFETDLVRAEVVRLAHLVYGIESQHVRSARLDAATVRAWTTPRGAQVLLPQTETIRGVILALVSPPG